MCDYVNDDLFCMEKLCNRKDIILKLKFNGWVGWLNMIVWDNFK